MNTVAAADRNRNPATDGMATDSVGHEARKQLLAGLPVAERRIQLAGVSTALLEGGDGPPMILLHGPGEFAPKWMRVIPDLTTTHRVIAPDLPCHGASAVPDGALDEHHMLAWLDELIEQTSPSPPVLVGHVLGGALAARYAVHYGERLSRLVLVDSLGLAAFRPAPRFALAMVHAMVQPNENTYNRFMRQCSYDLDGLREELGEYWDALASYYIDLARSPSSKAVGRLFREIGLPRIPSEDLARIAVPTSLIWGRQDRANRVQIAEAAARRYGWPLYVIESCADDPPRDQPEAFVEALRAALKTGNEQEAYS